jgi:hypothetical protein
LHYKAFTWLKQIQEFNENNNDKNSPLELKENSTNKGNISADSDKNFKWSRLITSVRISIMEW